MARIPVMKSIGWAIVWLMSGLTASVATAEVVTVVSAKSPVTVLSDNQVADIFLGTT